MTSLLHDDVRPGDDDAQRRMAKAILYMLHRARKPYELARAPFADAICRATGIENPGAALRYVVEESLRGDDARTARLRGVLSLDFSGDENFGDAAVRMHISRRHLQRFRAEAVAAVAYYVRKLLGSRCSDDVGVDAMNGDSLVHLVDLASKTEPGAAATIHQLTGAGVSESLQLVRLRAAVDQGTRIGSEAFATHPGIPRAVVAAFVAFSAETDGRVPAEAEGFERPDGPYSPAIRFELEYLAFLRARQRGFALEMRTVAASLRRLAGERGGALPIALQCQADASLRSGNVGEAHQHLDFAGRLTFSRSDLRQFAATTMLQSKMALYEEQTQRAEDLANGAYAVLNRNHRDAYACTVLVSQARWQRGAAWRPTPDAGRLGHSSWDRIAIDIEHARHLTREGRCSRARRLAAGAHGLAASFGFEGLAARAAGVLYAVALETSREEALYWRSDAIARLLRTQDHLLGVRLLASQRPNLEADDLLVDALHRRLCIYVPQMLGDGSGQRHAVRALLARCLEALRDPASGATRLRDAALAVNASDSAVAHYATQGAAGINELLVLTGLALAGRATGTERSNALQIASFVLEAMRPEHTRTFAIKT